MVIGLYTVREVSLQHWELRLQQMPDVFPLVFYENSFWNAPASLLRVTLIA